MDETKEKALGTVRINPDVIAQYAGMKAMECIGIVGMGAVSLKDGFYRILKSDRLMKGVSVSVKNNRITIDFHIIVAYGVSIQAVTDNLMENVAYHVEHFTGLPVDKINIYVEGVRVID
ncbi:MAG: Asp23/Gls24 family envelope stress response protein [Lachnospiraceae bacterium]|nr:Asp23/Gls24 family envelope stress response protein [Lachnospiraceae bacterium]